MAGTLGIDIGTTSVKVAILDDQGTICATASRGYPTEFGECGVAEQDPDDWWNAMRGALSDAFLASTVKGKDIRAIGVSGHAPSALAVDANTNALHPAIIWMDQRAEREANELREIWREDGLLSVVGNQADPYFGLPKLLWLKRAAPDIFRRARSFLQAHSYIVARLTGVMTLDPTTASLLLLFDAKTSIVTSLAEKLQFPLERLPPLFEPRTPVGSVSRGAAGILGLPPGTPVVAGAIDAATAALSASILEAGQAFEMSGESSGIGVCVSGATFSSKLVRFRHLFPNRWILKGSMTTTGGALRWFLQESTSPDLLRDGVIDDRTYDSLMSQIALTLPGSGGVFLPYLMGERSPIWDSSARGVLFGISLKTHRAQIARAIMEGVAFGLRHNMEAFAEAGVIIDHFVGLGGGYRSRLWAQVKADITGCAIRVIEGSLGSPIGAAILSGIGTAIWKDADEILRGLTKDRWTVRPTLETKKTYNELYHVYRQVYEKTRELFAYLQNTMPRSPQQEQEGT